MQRRDFLKRSGCLALSRSILPLPDSRYRAHKDSKSAINELRRLLGEANGSVFTQENADSYLRLTQFYNKRFRHITPAVLIYCRTALGVTKALQWCKENQIEFSIRSGGHSYEGLSRNRCAIIDVRGLNSISFDPKRHRLLVGSGTSLGAIYRTITSAGQAIPAGTCPTIGIAGHALAGGVGYLVRQFGLTIDSLRAIELVDASGSLLIADNHINADLFWALRGAGPGNFGIATNLIFETYQVSPIYIYSQTAVMPRTRASKFIADWQSWISAAPNGISSEIFAKKRQRTDHVLLEVKGLALGTERDVSNGLDIAINGMGKTARRTLRRSSFAQAFEWFTAGETLPPTYEKGKSDIVKRQLMASEWDFLLDELSPKIDAEIIGLGGRMAEISQGETAFAHRDGNLLIQWGIAWERPDQEHHRLHEINKFYQKLRPLMSDAAFLNYADCDLPDRLYAYWSANLPRLIEVKRRYDPENLFHHALSVPLHYPGHPISLLQKPPMLNE
jgi:FAD/FMN-containing dehydrogenase